MKVTEVTKVTTVTKVTKLKNSDYNINFQKISSIIKSLINYK